MSASRTRCHLSQFPPIEGWRWNRVRLEGDPTETIVKFAKDEGAQLILMTTDGPDRFLDGLRGTTSERVLRKAHCPVAVIPMSNSPTIEFDSDS